ncbi:MAG: methyltransferase domain-containing protein [Pseudomonadota bacterium]
MLHKDRIRLAFSKAAKTYDKYAMLQQAIAFKLATRLGERKFCNILEIGCGTGNYTLMLHKRYPSASITAIDFSEKMVEQAIKKNRGVTTSYYTR